MHIALFGGSFDPIHCGHITAATRLIERCGMDRVVIIPAALPPHKRGRQIASFSDRKNMIERAIDGYPRLILCDIEGRRVGPSYTIDTIESLLAHFQPEDEPYLVMGSDAFVELDTWKEWERILTSIMLLVIQRPRTDTSFEMQEADRTTRFLRQVLQYSGPESDGVSAVPIWRHRHRLPIRIVEIDAMPVSSSEIRRRIRCGASVEGLVPDAVERYIVERGLYRS